jgi:DNA-binding GntR family transcriptional regulator
LARAPDQEAVAELVHALEEDILFGRLRPRERLIEDELIGRLGATRHAVRQALVELEKMGVVVRIAKRGAQVRDFTREEVEQICAVREMLHAHAASLIPLPADPVLVSRLKKIHEAHSLEVKRQNLGAIHQLNNEFHETLFAASGNRYLAETIKEYARLSLGFRCHLMSNPVRAARARNQHARMIDALKRGDRAELVRLCVEHTRPSKEVYMIMQGWIEPGRAEDEGSAETTAGRRRA